MSWGVNAQGPKGDWGSPGKHVHEGSSCTVDWKSLDGPWLKTWESWGQRGGQICIVTVATVRGAGGSEQKATADIQAGQ